MLVFLRWDVLHNQADRIDDMTMRITSCEGGAGLLRPRSGFVQPPVQIAASAI
jgi:hypothetical protein